MPREREVKRFDTSYRDFDGGDGSLMRRAYVTFRGDDGYRTKFENPDELREIAEELADAADWLDEQRADEPDGGGDR